MDTNFQVGYWADPKYPYRMGKTHIKDVQSDRPYCGTKIGKTSEFLFVAHGKALSYVSCTKCKEKFLQE